MHKIASDLVLFGGDLRQSKLVEQDAILGFGRLSSGFAGGNGGRRHGVVQERCVVIQKQIVAQSVQFSLQFVLEKGMERKKRGGAKEGKLRIEEKSLIA